jgi:hypothetical protein
MSTCIVPTVGCEEKLFTRRAYFLSSFMNDSVMVVSAYGCAFMMILSAFNAQWISRGSAVVLEFKSWRTARGHSDLFPGVETETAEAVEVATLPWPKKLPEQVAAVRDRVLKGSSAWDLEQVASAFKGARRKEVADVLDSMATLGMLVRYEIEGKSRWKAARVGARGWGTMPSFYRQAACPEP